MPKAFSRTERETIRRRLLDVGRENFSRFGFRKANVAEICRSVGIAKGSFYLFFESKEALFLAMFEEIETEIRSDLVAELEQLRDDPKAMFKHFLSKAFQLLETHPVLRILADPEESQALFRKIPEAKLHANQEDDDAFFGHLLAGWQQENIIVPGDPLVMAGLIRAILALALQRELIGDRYHEIMDLLIDSLTDALVIV
ncbi:TetR/AcrR family transcriptional regulator [Candidatus Neomarinimicrobiota bacterium]